MCGIGGLLQQPGISEGQEVLHKINHLQKKRGPDEADVFWEAAGDWQIGLAHTRLQVIDPQGGRQPFRSRDGRFTLVFNGEIFNYLELAETLKQSGVQLKTTSDTEVLLEWLILNGREGLKDLSGMFAFALWDKSEREILLARDRAGVKPLYYSFLPQGGMIFASQLNAVFEHPSVSREVSREALARYLFAGYISAPHTIAKSCQKLLPGHCLSLKVGGEPQEWEYAPISNETFPGDLNGLVEELELRLNRAVSRSLAADVPLGLFLSGGIDSSLITAIARKHAGERIKTFGIGFEDPQFDEGLLSRALANHLGTDHSVETLSEEKLLSYLPGALESLDEPMADPSLIPTFALSEVTRREVTVALSGDGGDELWGGYPTYFAHRMSGLPKMMPNRWRQLIGDWSRQRGVDEDYQSWRWKLERFFGYWEEGDLNRHLTWMAFTHPEELEKLLGKVDHLHLISGERLEIAGRKQDLNRYLLLDYLTYLPGSVLCKVDRASMAHSLEVRPPLLDKDVIELAWQCPADLKVQGKANKVPLRRLGAKYLPAETASRKKKGFAIPLAKWLNGPLQKRMEEVIHDQRFWQDMGLNAQAGQTMWQEQTTCVRDHSRPLWALMVLWDWQRRAL